MGFDTTVIDFDDFNEDQFRESRLAICLLSTYGEGEPTDNAAEFVKWLKSAEEGALQGLQYSVFGLGNTEYEHFNRVGKLVDKQLEKLGASRAFELGIGDDGGTLEVIRSFCRLNCCMTSSLLRKILLVTGAATLILRYTILC